MLSYVADHGLPAVVTNVSNPYGPPDWQPRQGMFVKMAAQGKMPFYVRGVGSEVVGIDDVADALLLAAEKGRIGQRYIISERYMSQRELVTVAAQAVGARPPRIGIPMAVIYGLGWVNDALGALLRKDFPMSRQSARLVELTSPASHAKATRELGWHPTPTEDSIRRAAHAYVERSVAAS